MFQFKVIADDIQVREVYRKTYCDV